MAGCSKQFDFVFDGGLLSQTRASLVNEVVKYLLYERNQIPLQFDILKQQMTVSEAKNSQVRQRHATPFLLPFHFSFCNYSNIIPYTSLARMNLALLRQAWVPFAVLMVFRRLAEASAD